MPIGTIPLNMVKVKSKAISFFNALHSFENINFYYNFNILRWFFATTISFLKAAVFYVILIYYIKGR